MIRLLFVALLLLPASTGRAQDAVLLESPGSNVTITVGVRETIDHGPRLHYAVTYGGQSVLLDSPFGLAFKGAPPFSEGVEIRSVDRRSNAETWRPVWGKRSEISNRYNEMTVTLGEMDGPNRTLELVFRAYDDGVAFRYVLPDSWGEFRLAEEQSTFVFPGTPIVWAANYESPAWSGLYGGFVSPQEGEFHRMPMSDLDPNTVYGCPLLVHVGPSVWAAFTESDLTDWAGMYFARVPGERSVLTTSLSPRRDEPDVLVRSTAPRLSPWRTILLGSAPTDLIESSLVQNLNDPADGDFSWVEPGKSAWDRWWSNDYAPEVDFAVGMNTATMKYFVDLAAEMGWEYQLVDADWYGPPFAVGSYEDAHPTSDITTVIPALDMPELIRYAGERGVGILVWLHWAHARDQMEKAFPLYEQWGIRGVKVDYMNRDDQEMVQYYHRLVELAAKHHLLVDFHGAYKPTGWSRTFPNVITREGVLGNEYNKWSAQVTPQHNVTIPFTRGLLGEMDFTPGGFRQRTADSFETQDPAANVMGTRVHQLAMLVVYESALQVLADSPYNYRSSPAGTDFLRLVPTTWDHTRALAGFPGEFVTIARRSGDEWYLASMTNWTPRTLETPLDFLGPGRYRAEVWADAFEAADYPDRLIKRERTVTASDTLSAWLAPGGGYLVRFVPVP